MTEKERAILAQLQQSLGVTVSEAAGIEQDVRRALAPAAEGALAPALT